jgi:hypothetical protein
MDLLVTDRVTKRYGVLLAPRSCELFGERGREA